MTIRIVQNRIRPAVHRTARRLRAAALPGVVAAYPHQKWLPWGMFRKEWDAWPADQKRMMENPWSAATPFCSMGVPAPAQQRELMSTVRTRPIYSSWRIGSSVAAWLGEFRSWLGLSFDWLEDVPRDSEWLPAGV